MSREGREERIEIKIDKMADDISQINVTLASQHESLKEHIRRTELLESEIEPVKKHVAMVHGALKLIGAIAAGIAMIEALVSILSYLRK